MGLPPQTGGCNYCGVSLSGPGGGRALALGCNEEGPLFCQSCLLPRPDMYNLLAAPRDDYGAGFIDSRDDYGAGFIAC